MIYREATINDIPGIQFVRNAVLENRLSDPSLVTDRDCEVFMTVRGKAWVCEMNNAVVAFTYVDLKENNVWALFVQPEYAERGIGKTLHKIMLDWYFSVCRKTIWLGTEPGTRAECFYRKQGWKENGKYGKEIKFEMSYENWNSR